MSALVGFSRWTHKEKGGTYTYLTTASSEGKAMEHGMYVYGLRLLPTGGHWQAVVMTMDDWNKFMVPEKRRDDDGPEKGRPESTLAGDFDDLI